MKYKQWNFRAPRGEDCRAMIAAGIPPLPAAVLCARGLDTPDKARAFLDDGEDLLHDPFLLRDMDRAAARLNRALAGQETIAVFGDYDVDGITSTCLLTDYLKSRGGKVVAYIPDRIEEGYGLSCQALDALCAQGVSLVVTVDCGITAVEETDHAAALQMDVIITDHHECKEQLPRAAAVVDPHRSDCTYPFSQLAGVGVTLKLVLAMEGAAHGALLDRYADLAAIGTVADVMQLTGENRAIVRLGLEALSHTRRPGLRALIRECGLEGKSITSTSIGYTLAPRINASGRMGCAGMAVELLLTEDPCRAEELARDLCDLNRERQAIEGEIYEECTERLDREGPRHCAIVLASEGWHQGVVGIVASRLAERYSCPAFMICLSDQGKGKGSCRSFGGFNLFAALEQCADLLEGFGGHELAAGFTISADQIDAFRERMKRIVLARTGGAEMISQLQVDAELTDPGLLTREGVESLALLEPYGAGNPKPVFVLSGMTVISLTEVGGGRHLKLRLRHHGAAFDAIFFSATAAQTGLAAGDRVDAAFTPQVNEFRGARSVQLQIVDLRRTPTRAQAERALLERFRAGEPITAAEAESLIPTREEFEAVWRYLKQHASPSVLEDNPGRLAKNIARSYHLRETFVRTMVCLQVFDERGLIRVERRSPGQLQIGLRPVEGKVDLEQSALMRRLRALMES